MTRNTKTTFQLPINQVYVGHFHLLGMVNYLAKYARINMNNIRYNHGILKYDGYTSFLTILECLISIHYLSVAAFLLAIRR